MFVADSGARVRRANQVQVSSFTIPGGATTGGKPGKTVGNPVIPGAGSFGGEVSFIPNPTNGGGKGK